MRKNGKRLMALLLSLTVSCSLLPVSAKACDEENGKNFEPEKFVSASEVKVKAQDVPQNAQEIVCDMGLGFNMGKVFSQSIPDNISTFKKTIDAVAAKGFETVRIPTNWTGHIDADGHLTDTKYVQQVKSFVKYAMDKGLYVILNSHEDLGFSENSYWDLSQVTTDKFKTQYTNLWKDIAKEFPYSEFGYHLLFEATNEPKNYKGPVYDYTDYKNKPQATRNSIAYDGWYFAGRCSNLKYMETLNEMFATTMAEAAPERYYMITSYNANVIAATKEYSSTYYDSTGKGIKEDLNYGKNGEHYLHMPDKNKAKAILSVHIYDIDQWDSYLGKLKESMNSKHIDIPVYIGETGMYWANKDKSGPLLKHLITSARENNISAALWDDSQSMSFINRKTGEWYDANFMDELIAAGHSAKPVSKSTVSAKPKKVVNLKVKVMSSRKIKISWKKKPKCGYQVAYATNKKFKHKKVKNCKKATITLKNLKRKTYYVKVRAYRKVNGKKVYGPWSKAKKINNKRKQGKK